MKYPHVAARIFNTPLLIHPQKLDAIIAGLGQRLVGAEIEMTSEGEASAVVPELFSTRRGQRSDGGYVVSDGVAVIFASGALVHRTRMEANSTRLLGYNDLAMVLENAMADPEVHAVLQVFDSPGGEVSGAFEYSDRIHALRGKKPSWAIADSMAASAAYLSGSAFERLAVSQTGYAGSIGVVMRHVDLSRALANDGVTVTHIFAGDRKIDGNPYEPLPKDVQANLQQEVDALYALFVDAVVRNTGLSAEAVRATQAAMYRGQAAVDLGLAQRVTTTDQLLSELAALRVRSFPVGQTARANANDKGVTMSGNTNPGGQQAAQPTAPLSVAFTQADLDTARAEGRAAGAAAERQRITDVRAQSLPGHEALIETLAFDGKTTGPEAASAVLAAERTTRAAAAKAFLDDAPAPVVTSAAPEDGTALTGKALAAQAVLFAKAHKGV